MSPAPAPIDNSYQQVLCSSQNGPSRCAGLLPPARPPACLTLPHPAQSLTGALLLLLLLHRSRSCAAGWRLCCPGRGTTSCGAAEE